MKKQEWNGNYQVLQINFVEKIFEHRKVVDKR